MPIEASFACGGRCRSLTLECALFYAVAMPDWWDKLNSLDHELIHPACETVASSRYNTSSEAAPR